MSKRAQRHGQVKVSKGPIPDGIAVLGLDIGSRTHVGRFWAAPGEREAARSFTNTTTGAAALLAWLDARTGGDRSRVVVGFEPTGSYWQGFVGRLVAAGVCVRVIAPQHTKKYKELFDNSPNKSDAKDAGVIAELTKRGHGLLLRLPQGAYAELRALNEGYHRATQRITAVQNQAREVAFGLFPELGVAIDPFTATGRALWAATPTPAAWLAKRRSTRERLVRQASQGRFGAAWVAQLTEGARDSLGATEGVAARVSELSFLLAELDRWEARRATLEAALVATLDGCPEGAWLASVPRLGRASAARILGETGPLADFASGQAVLKHAGLNLYARASGKRTPDRVCYRITKRGRSRLRHVLFFAALRLVQRGGAFHAYYRRLVDDNGVVKVRAVVAVMRKLLRVLTALARDHAAYDPASVPV
jgi:transposase